MHLNSLTSLKLSVSTIAPGNVDGDKYEEDISVDDVKIGIINKRPITNQRMIDAFDNSPIGTSFSYSLNASYAGGLSVVKNPGSSNFNPKLITLTPSIYLATIIKSITSSPFILQPTFTNRGTGALSFSSSNADVATVNSSSGLVTMVGEGTTTIRVSLAAAQDNTYSYLPVSTTATLLVTSSPSNWRQIGGDIDGEGGNNNNGGSVSLSADGTVVAMGAPSINSYSTNSGKVRVYKYKDEIKLWSQLGGDLDGETPGDNSGWSVSISGDGSRVAIGAYLNDGNGDASGHVRVYQYNSGKTTANSLGPAGWDQLGGDIDGEAANDLSGHSVSLSYDGSKVAIGGRSNDNSNGNDSGHVRVYQYNGTTWTQLGGDIDGEYWYDYSGWSVSLSADGNRVAIGAPYNDNSNGNESGHVRVYQYNGTTWTKLGQDLDGEAVYDNSGFSVSLSSDGNRVAIGAPFNDGTTANSNSGHGHVRVYQYNGTTLLWTKLGQDLDGEAAYDNSGFSVSLSSDGNRVAIGAQYNDNSNGIDSGQVRVYQYNGTTLLWTQIGQDIDGEAAYDNSGLSVSISADGNRVAIGAPYNDGPTGLDSGQVRVYQYNGTTWAQIGQDLDGEATDDWSGRNVSLSSDGTIVAVTAQYNDNSNGPNSGQVRVYKYNPNKTVAQMKPLLPGFGPVGWDRLGQDIDGEAANDWSGRTVSISSDGTRVAIGANSNDGNGIESGHVRVYQYNGTTLLWTQLGQDIDGEAAYDLSGRGVSLSADGNRVAVGANSNDGNGIDSGQVRVYQYNGTTWTQIGQDIDGEAAYNYSGWSVSLSSDGSIVAIGAPYNDNSNGIDSGQVRVYQYNGTTLLWTQLGQDIDGEAVYDNSGISVSISADGNRVAIGAPYNDNSNGIDSGQVRVYQYNGTTLLWTQIGQDIDGEAAYDNSGLSVSLSSDGSIVAIGAPYNDGTTVYSDSGHVRVYQYNGTTWTKIGKDIDGEQWYDYSGTSVSISSDGTRVAIGATHNDGNGNESGQVRVYQLS
jgi:hypothetical protein